MAAVFGREGQVGRRCAGIHIPCIGGIHNDYVKCRCGTCQLLVAPRHWRLSINHESRFRWRLGRTKFHLVLHKLRRRTEDDGGLFWWIYGQSPDAELHRNCTTQNCMFSNGLWCNFKRKQYLVMDLLRSFIQLDKNIDEVVEELKTVIGRRWTSSMVGNVEDATRSRLAEIWVKFHHRHD